MQIKKSIEINKPEAWKSQQGDFYDFYNEEKFVGMSFNSARDIFVSGKSKKYERQGCFELKKYQQNELVELENTRFWLTDAFVGR